MRAKAKQNGTKKKKKIKQYLQLVVTITDANSSLGVVYQHIDIHRC